MASWFSAFEAGTAAIVTGVATAVGTFLALRRKFSSDTKEIAHDKVEASFVRTLMTERDAAMKAAQEAWATRTADAIRIAKLEAQLEGEKERTKEMREEILVLRLRTARLMALAVKSDPHALAMLAEDGDTDATMPGAKIWQAPSTE